MYKPQTFTKTFILEAINRFIAFNDWITFICLFALILLVIAKNTSLYHFRNFLLLIVSDKYIKTHKEDTSKKRIHYTLILFQAIIIPLIIFTLISNYNSNDNFDTFFYLKICGLYSSFFIIKFILEKGTGYLLGFESQISSYLFQKQSYFNYLAIWLYPILLGATYYFKLTPMLIYIFIIICLFLMLISITLAITNHRKLFYSKPYYFILYLCTFEIAPYILSFFIIPKVI